MHLDLRISVLQQFVNLVHSLDSFLVLLERFLASEGLQEDDDLIRLEVGNIGLREFLDKFFARERS